MLCYNCILHMIFFMFLAFRFYRACPLDHSSKGPSRPGISCVSSTCPESLSRENIPHNCFLNSPFSKLKPALVRGLDVKDACDWNSVARRCYRPFQEPQGHIIAYGNTLFFP